MARPSDFAADIAAEILERMADGESLRAICRDEHMPSKAAVFRWLAAPAHASFRDQYALAREAQADAYADDIVDIADRSRRGKIVKVTPIVGKDDDGNEVVLGEKVETTTSDNVNRSRLMIDARKWFAGKVAPKKYGNAVDKTAGGDQERAVTDLESLAHDDQKGTI